MAVTIHYDKDIDRGALAGKKVAVIGYGSQGHAHAQNLRESGVDVMVAELAGTPNHRQATDDGFAPVSAAEAAKAGDLIIMTAPDELQAKIYEAEIGPNLTAGKALGFCHGFNIHFKAIQPPADVDVVMIAPKGPGHLVRSEFARGGGVPCLIAIEQDPSGHAKDVALAWGSGIGVGRAGIIETTFKDETETDLFGEQVVLCGGVSELIKAAFETLTDAGYEPEMAFFECMHEMKLIVDLFYQGGLSYMWYSVSNTAEYGGLTRGPRIVNDQTRAEMKKILAEVTSGEFAKEWLAECAAGKKRFNELATRDHDHALEVVGRKLRKLMPWIEAKEV